MKRLKTCVLNEARSQSLHAWFHEHKAVPDYSDMTHSVRNKNNQPNPISQKAK